MNMWDSRKSRGASALNVQYTCGNRIPVNEPDTLSHRWVAFYESAQPTKATQGDGISSL